MTPGRRRLVLASAALPALAACAGNFARHRGRPVADLARDLGVCSAAYVVLRAAQPGPAVLVSGCAGPGTSGEPIFQAASLTKPVVAFAALQLALDGRLDLDKAASHYLPAGYRHFHSVLERRPEHAHDLVPAAVLDRIPVRTLLNHTSGLPNWSRTALSPMSEPGQRWRYSGEGFMLLQSVIEAITREEISAHIDRQVFARLGMADSSLAWHDRLASRLALGTSTSGSTRQVRFSTPAAAASLYTTATDYAKFMAALLSHPPTVSLILSGRVLANKALGIEWGLGWGIEQGAGGPCLWQWGNNPGYRAFAMASVASRDGFVILTNSERGMPLAASLAHSALPTEHPAFELPGVA